MFAGRPGLPHAKRILIPKAEWYGFVLHDRADRILHVNSETWYNDIEVRFRDTPRLQSPRRRRQSVPQTKIIGTIKQTKADHPNFNYHAIIKGVGEELNAPRPAVRDAWNALKAKRLHNLHWLYLFRPPSFVEPRLKRTVETQEGIPSLAGDGRHPVVFFVGRSLRSEINIH